MIKKPLTGILRSPSRLRFPKVKLSAAERVWLEAVYAKLLTAERPNVAELLVELWNRIPKQFDCRKIDRRLLRDGNEITLLGILHIHPKTSLIGETDSVLRFIQSQIRNNPKW